jgi:sensor c-di-GMP phosphodiesterase-like protein
LTSPRQRATALETIAAGVADDEDPDVARRVAALVAATVAAEVIAQTKLTDDAALRVALAVTLAADADAAAAVAAAAVVETAAGTAETSAHDMAGSSVATQLASDIAVGSTARVATMALRQVALLRRDPMVAELQRALERAEVRLHDQPMYDMQTGAVVGVEAADS